MLRHLCDCRAAEGAPCFAGHCGNEPLKLNERVLLAVQVVHRCTVMMTVSVWRPLCCLALALVEKLFWVAQPYVLCAALHVRERGHVRSGMTHQGATPTQQSAQLT